MVRLGLFFAAVPDPRAGNARHDLSDLLFIAFAAMLCGAETCVDMAEFGASKAALLGSIVALDHGVPSHDTFSRLFRLLNPEKFEAAFRAFMTSFAAALSGQIGTAGQIVALDGKSLRGAVDTAKRTQPLHLVTAWAADQRLVLGLRRARSSRCSTSPRPPSPPMPCTATGSPRRRSAPAAATMRWPSRAIAARCIATPRPCSPRPTRRAPPPRPRPRMAVTSSAAPG
jgi:hypothetical protein